MSPEASKADVEAVKHANRTLVFLVLLLIVFGIIATGAMLWLFNRVAP